MGTSADLLLHPVRLRVVQALLGGQQCTTTELAAALPDVPTATLYRQIARLAHAGVLRVTAERAVRGVVERTYSLDLPAAQIDAASARALSAAEHRRLFRVFVAGLLADFDRCLDREGIDTVADNVSYRQNALWLTDAEYARFTRDIGEVFLRYSGKAPGTRRRRRLLSFITLPASASETTR